MRKLKFRAWVGAFEYYTYDIQEREDMFEWFGQPTIDIEQYTGLKDKNDKEIYEGDIVKEENGWIHVVHWSDDEVGSCGCCVDEFWGTGFVITKHSDPTGCKVIGNIHENKELLEENINAIRLLF